MILPPSRNTQYSLSQAWQDSLQKVCPRPSPRPSPAGEGSECNPLRALPPLPPLGGFALVSPRETCGLARPGVDCPASAALAPSAP